MGEELIDGWSFVHFGIGYVAAKTNYFSAFSFLVAHTIFELWENSEAGVQWYQDNGFPRYKGDALLNTHGDTVWAMLGYFAGE